MNTLPVTAPASNLGQALPHDVGSLHVLVRRYESELTERDAAIAQRDARIEHLQAQVRLLLARRFAPSPDRDIRGQASETLPDGQLGLFNEAEASAAPESESAPGTEVAAHRRATPKRAPLPDALARIDIEHSLAHDERTCPRHGVELERFGAVVSEQLDIIPAQMRVLRHVRGKYRRPQCEGHLRTAPMPAQPLPKSLASLAPRGHREVRRCAAAVSPAPATEAPRGRPLTHHAGDVDGARRRTRGPPDEPATRGVARPALPADGRNHRAGAQRTRQGRAIEVPTLGADERRPPASGPRGQAPNRPSSCSTTTPPAPATPPNACLQGSPARCTPTATAAMDRWYASRGWCTWRAGPMPGAGSPTPSKASA